MFKEYTDKSPLVSVIIPVYNVSRYLPQCIDSVVAQTYQNLEIVIIDDGSTDESGSICDQYAKRYDRIQVIHSENLGLASARNRGLENTCGDYLLFIDSDDWIEPHAVETLLRAALQTDSDIVSPRKCFEFVGMTVHDEEGGECRRTYSGQDLLLAMADAKFGNHVWGKLYKAECFKEIRFPDGYNYEDVLVTVRVMTQIAEKGGSLTFLPDELIHFRVRKSSISHTHTFKNNNDSWKAYYGRYKALSGSREKLLSECIESIRRMWISFPGYSKEEKVKAQKTIREMQAFSRRNFHRIMSGDFSKYEKMTCLFSQSRSLLAMRLVTLGSRIKEDFRSKQYTYFD